ncbi:MAG: DUF4169 family protein [Devosia sp.]|jgi:hypothetical protein
MAEIVNLRTIRKRKVRDEQTEVAAQNRVLFGRTKAERDRIEAERLLAKQKLDGHQRED